MRRGTCGEEQAACRLRLARGLAACSKLTSNRAIIRFLTRWLQAQGESRQGAHEEGFYAVATATQERRRVHRSGRSHPAGFIRTAALQCTSSPPCCRLLRCCIPPVSSWLDRELLGNTGRCALGDWQRAPGFFGAAYRPCPAGLTANCWATRGGARSATGSKRRARRCVGAQANFTNATTPAIQLK